MKTIDYKSLRDFEKATKEIAEKLPFVSYGNFHFGNTTRHRIYRKSRFEKGITIVYGILENGIEYTKYTDYV